MSRHLTRTTVLLLAILVASATFAQEPAPRVKLATNLGDIVIEMMPAESPKTVANFLKYVEADFYNGTVFHRVIDRFMVQGGGFTESLMKKQTYGPIENESKNGVSNLRGTISMARTGDPHSATAQFFINTVDNEGLDADQADNGWGYAVFGKVVEGLDVVDAISSSEIKPRGRFPNMPAETVKIETASVVE